MTSIRAIGPFGARAGFQSHGRKTRAEMTAAYRDYYAREAARAEKALSVPDEDLVVETFVGTFATKNMEVVQ